MISRRFLLPTITRPLLFKTMATYSKQYPQTIKAVQYTGTGGPEVIKLNEIPFPEAKPDEVLIRVQWAGVNFIDTYFRQGVYKLQAIPWTAGQDVAGIVERLPTDPDTLNNPDYKARKWELGQKVTCITGTAYAEYVAKPWQKVMPVPESIDAKTAVAAALQGLTATSFVEEAYSAQSGDYVLVHAAAGGLGLLLCQILKARGAHVIGSVSTAEKCALAKENGAEFVVNYRTENLVQRVAEITQGEGVQGIYDGVGKTTWEGNFEMIRRKGTIVSIGNASGVAPDFSPLKLGAKNIRLVRPVVNNYVFTAAETTHYYNELWDFIQSGALKLHIYKEYPFTAEGVAAAQVDQASGKTTGKLIIKIAD